MQVFIVLLANIVGTLLYRLFSTRLLVLFNVMSGNVCEQIQLSTVILLSNRVSITIIIYVNLFAHQASLNLSHGGLGLRFLYRHAPAAYISSLTTSMLSDNCSVTSKVYFLAAVNAYNASQMPSQLKVYLMYHPPQHVLSSHIEEADFSSLFSDATTVTKARLQAISAPQAHAWLKVQPSPKLGLALMPDEAQVILKWWLGLPFDT